MTWIAPPAASYDGPSTGADRPIVAGYLSWQRATLGNICAGLTSEQLVLRPLPSNLSLLGIVRHVAKVERVWFRIRTAAEPLEPLFDPDLGADYDFDHLEPERAQADFETWQEEIRLAEVAAAGYDPDLTFERNGETMSLGFVYVHMVAEYARHNGHADLIREAIDGVTGR